MNSDCWTIYIHTNRIHGNVFQFKSRDLTINMNSNEKLRQEIAQLSNLIASSRGGTTSSTPSLSPAHPRPKSVYSYRSISIGNTSLSVPPERHNAPQYLNPFRYSVTDGYARQIFPEPYPRNRSVLLNPNCFTSSSRIGFDDTLRRSDTPSALTVHIHNDRISNGNLAVPPPSTSFVVANSVNYNAIYSNCTLLGSSGNTLRPDISNNDPIADAISKTVRPHVNPAHSAYQLIKNNAVSCINSSIRNITTTVKVESHSGADSEVQILLNDSSVGSSSIVNHKDYANGHTNNSSSRDLGATKTKYKLDRRVKQSLQKASRIRRISNQNLESIQKTKLFKRYSMRLVSKPKLNTTSQPYYLKKPGAYTQRQRSKTYVRAQYKLTTSPVLRNQRTLPSIKGKHKTILEIDGSNYIRKNGGKSLKRVRSRNSTCMINIKGDQFIKKNGGRSLKRVKESFSIKAKSLHPQVETPGLRLAHRAIVKSKLTLSQRIWKKKQFCIFYNRFGECKRKETGSCPYLHDRKQLMICPKFIVGKCEATDCKLSHDLKVGRMPPCQFFNRSKCSRENCPYPHIKSSPIPKNSTKTDKESQENKPSSSTPRKRKVSIRKTKASPNKTKSSKKVKTITDISDVKSRYYEQLPDSEPVLSIIPRRLPRDIPNGVTHVHDHGLDDSDSDSGTRTKVENVVSTTSVPSVVPPVSINSSQSANNVCDSIDSRRTRLMSKVSRLVERVKKKESVAPHFLPLS